VTGHAVIIGYVWPEPGSSAAGRHMMEIIQVLKAKDWQIIFASAAAKSDHQADLSALGIKSKTIELNSSRFDRWIAQLQPELVIYDRFYTEEQFSWRVAKVSQHTLHVLDTEDLHFLREGRALTRDGQATSQAQITASDIAYRELASIYRSDLSLIISSAEMQQLQQTFNVDSDLLHYFPFLMNLNDAAAQNSYAQRKDFVFVGTLRHQPNLQAVRLLKKQLWPLIRKQLPNTRLNIIGSYMTKEVSQMHKPAEGFHVLGRVDDLEQALLESRVMLAPLMFGAGLKGKLIDAMEQGVPSVTTPVGAEGISDDNWPGLVAIDVPQLANASVRLYQDEDFWTECQRAGFALLREKFDQKTHTDKLASRLEDLMENLTAFRSRNFIGSMLRHHFHASTEYMSRWIECKNKKSP